jgi:hypothetical protein
MPGNPREMITLAERHFPVRIGSLFLQAVSANGIPKSPLGSTRTAVRTGGSWRHPGPAEC